MTFGDSAATGTNPFAKTVTQVDGIDLLRASFTSSSHILNKKVAEATIADFIRLLNNIRETLQKFTRSVAKVASDRHQAVHS